MRMKNKPVGWWILSKLDMVRKLEIWITLWVLEYTIFVEQNPPKLVYDWMIKVNNKCDKGSNLIELMMRC